MEASFVNALQQKIENAIDSQSVVSDITHQSLVKKIKRNSHVLKGMQDYFNHRRKSLIQGGAADHLTEVPPSPQFGVIIEDLEKEPK